MLSESLRAEKQTVSVTAGEVNGVRIPPDPPNISKPDPSPQPGGNITCAVAGCQEDFLVRSDYDSHIEQKHKQDSAKMPASNNPIEHTPDSNWPNDSGNPKDWRSDICDTVLVMWYIAQIFPSEKGTWELSVRKALNWIRKETGFAEDKVDELTSVLKLNENGRALQLEMRI